MVEKVYKDKKLCIAVIIVAAILFLTVTNYTKVFLGKNSITRALIWNSENLVYNAMLASYFDEEECEYGLYDVIPYNGTYVNGVTDEEMGVEFGYSVKEPVLVLDNNNETRQIFKEGNRLIFFNGDQSKVVSCRSEGEYLFVEYDSDKIYGFGEQGDLRYLLVYSEDENAYCEMGKSEAYVSQIGLQGKVFCAYPKENTISEMRTIYQWTLSILFSVVVTFICYGIYKKYNALFAIVFYAVTALSPWVIGYATNLYWVEFTWFLPMLFGIICANNIENKKVRMISYIGVMLSIALKCACGYEYITTIMLSAIVFLLVDFTIALLEQKDKARIKRLFKTIFIMGIFALVGFAIALVCHAYIRGWGNIYNGLRSIYYNDVLRRTFGDPNMFQDVYADSLNASIIRVLIRYVVFDTPLIFGVPGILFLPLAAASFFILVYGIWKKNADKQMLVLYIWMGIAAVSWFVLGKSHSYIHTGMNFVMWYFGYMQIVFYILVQTIWDKVKKVKEDSIDEKR